MEEQILESIDGYKLNLHIFEAVNPISYIEIIHGMEEHQERYETFISDLVNKGYTCISHDLRGHGTTAPILGYFSKKDGDKLLIEDERIIREYILKRYNIKNFIIFAHSFGTIITRNLLMEDSKYYQKIILSGAPFPAKSSFLGMILSNLIVKFKGASYNSKFLQKMVNKTFIKKIKNRKTNYDMLSFNEENIKKYIEDEYCGHGFKAKGYNDLFKLTLKMGKSKNYKNVNNDLKLMTLVGESDPFTGFEKGVRKSIKVLEKAGFKNILLHKYNARHEILNEACYNDVVKDTINFIKEN